MSKRLEIAKNLLSKEGVIFISIDDNEVSQLKLLCDNIFGENNFIAKLIVSSNSSKNNSKYISVSHEYLLCYVRNIDLLTKDWKVKKQQVDAYESKAKQLLKKGLSSEEIHEELLQLVKYPRFYDFDHYTFADKRGIYGTWDMGGVQNGNFQTELLHPITNKICVKPNGGWRYKEETLLELLKNDDIAFGKDETIVPRVKRYLHDYNYQVPKSVMFFDSQSSTKWLKKQNIDFSFPKAIELIKHVISFIPNRNSIILDFFAGSGTTGHAVAQLNKEDGGNRRYILCTNNENGICENITYQRLKNIQEELPHKLKYLKTDFIDRFSDEDAGIKQKLMPYIKALIELEHGCEIDNIHYLFILTEEELEHYLTEDLVPKAKIFIAPYILLDQSQHALIHRKQAVVIDIPEYYFRNELVASGEL